jgi:hypothetical protein
MYSFPEYKRTISNLTNRYHHPDRKEKYSPTVRVFDKQLNCFLNSSLNKKGIRKSVLDCPDVFSFVDGKTLRKV